MADHTIPLSDHETATLRVMAEPKTVEEFLADFIKNQVAVWALEKKQARLDAIMAEIAGDPVKLVSLEDFLGIKDKDKEG
jgi:hypothetical protein